MSISAIGRRVLHLKGYFPPHILYVFKFSHHSTAFLVETNSQCSSYIRHFFVYKAVICQVVFPHKLKQRAFPSFDCAFFFLPLPFFFLCDAMFSFLNPCAPAYQAVYFFFCTFDGFDIESLSEYIAVILSSPKQRSCFLLSGFDFHLSIS